MNSKLCDIGIISIACLVGLAFLEIITWWAFTYYYPSINWVMYGNNPEPFYRILTEFFAAILIIGNGLVAIIPASKEVRP